MKIEKIIDGRLSKGDIEFFKSNIAMLKIVLNEKSSIRVWTDDNDINISTPNLYPNNDQCHTFYKWYQK